jgi:hypothetical protein
MRARPREVNIFNMSLLDILCGALGAFCFMMLVALPYYVVGSPDRAQTQKATEDLLKDVEKLRERMSDPAQAEELRKLIDNLEAQIKQLQGQVNQYAYDKEQLQKQNDDLNAKNESQDKLLKQRKPFAIIASADDESQDVDVYLEDDLAGEKTGKSVNPPFDPAKKWHTSNWSNDITGLSLPDRGFATWVASNTVPGAHYRVFVKFGNDPKKWKTTVFSGIAMGDFEQATVLPLGDVTLSPQRFWELLGTFTADENYKLTFARATQEERDQEWRAKKMQPPPVPTPPPEPGSAQSATAAAIPRPSIDFADMERKRKELQERRRMEEERRAREGQQPSPTAPAATPDLEALRKRREQLRQQMQNLSPTPQP